MTNVERIKNLENHLMYLEERKKLGFIDSDSYVKQKEIAEQWIRETRESK
jgi:hypothetical protein